MFRQHLSKCITWFSALWLTRCGCLQRTTNSAQTPIIGDHGGSGSRQVGHGVALLNDCQTSKYMGVDFLDFLRSGEKDIHAFAESRRSRKRRMPTNPPPGSPSSATPDSGNPS